MTRDGCKLGRMASLAQHFLEMARNNAWANHRLHAACALLNDAELKAVHELWPGIRFHALREHAGLVFHSRPVG